MLDESFYRSQRPYRQTAVYESVIKCIHGFSYSNSSSYRRH